jgi:broad-specificity NMP kinase
MKNVKRIKVVFEGYPVILVSGTPGTGKSTIIKKIKEQNESIQVLNISELVKEEGLHDGYDEEFETFIINDRKTQKKLKKLIPTMKQKGPILIECHSCGLFDEDDMEALIDKVLVLTCSTESLYDRLKFRSYPQKKIDENMECEIMRVCADEALEVFRGEGVVKEFVNDSESDQRLILKFIKSILKK